MDWPQKTSGACPGHWSNRHHRLQFVLDPRHEHLAHVFGVCRGIASLISFLIIQSMPIASRAAADLYVMYPLIDRTERRSDLQTFRLAGLSAHEFWRVVIDYMLIELESVHDPLAFVRCNPCFLWGHQVELRSRGSVCRRRGLAVCPLRKRY